ncbi:MAG TPA: nucleotide-binding domain containing protein, partial [Pusillimonas sp.]
AAQEKLGVERAGALVEEALAEIARQLVHEGVRQLIVAGGETSGAVVTALNVRSLRIGPTIDPGVPWTVSLGATPIALALKSGNFGAIDFFTKAWSLLS